MSHNDLFIETIRLQYGKLHNIPFHNARANRTRHEVLGISNPIDLAGHIVIPPSMGKGLFKCRVLYGHEIGDVQIEPYRRTKIKSLKLIDGGDIDYRYKYADRVTLDALYERRGDCDDVLIIKDGLVTDTSYANVAFYDERRWYTPATPLLAGTKRQQLIDDGLLEEDLIRVADLFRYHSCTVFNALRGFVPASALPISSIV